MIDISIIPPQGGGGGGSSSSPPPDGKLLCAAAWTRGRAPLIVCAQHASDANGTPFSRWDRRCAIGRLTNSRRCNDRVNDCVRGWWSFADYGTAPLPRVSLRVSKKSTFFHGQGGEPSLISFSTRGKRGSYWVFDGRISRFVCVKILERRKDSAIWTDVPRRLFSFRVKRRIYVHTSCSLFVLTHEARESLAVKY